jgi:hypothetical protein
MRRNASTVVVLAGPAPGEVLAALGRSMNVALVRPEEPEEGTDGLTAAAAALQRAGRATSPYALVPADPLAAVAASWREMWDVSKQEPAQQAAGVLHALGSLRHGPWWPGLDEVIEAARRFYPDSLAGGNATGLGPATPAAGRVRAG